MESNEANFKIKHIKKPLSGVSWYKLRESPALSLLRDRLDEIDIMYPSAVTYSKFLWRTSTYKISDTIDVLQLPYTVHGPYVP